MSANLPTPSLQPVDELLPLSYFMIERSLRFLPSEIGRRRPSSTGGCRIPVKVLKMGASRARVTSAASSQSRAS